MKQDKYIVFDRDQFDAWWKESSGRTPFYPPPLEAGSYFLLRSQDIFGSQAVHGWAHLVQSALELDALREIFTDEERERLEKLCEEATAVAESWADRGEAKVPD